MSLRLRGRAKRKEAVPQAVIGTDVRRVGGLDAQTYKTILAAEQAALAQRAKFHQVDAADSRKGKRKDKRKTKIQLQQGSFRKVGGISLHQETADNTVTTLTLDRSIGETAGIEFQCGDGFEKSTGTYIRHIDMGSAAETMGLQLGDEVLVINGVDVGDRPVEEVLSIVQAASLVVMQVRKTSMPDIIAWQADAAVGALAVGSVHDAMLSQAQAHRDQQSKHEALTLALPDEPRAKVEVPSNGRLDNASSHRGSTQQQNDSFSSGTLADTSNAAVPSPRNVDTAADPTTVANTIVNGISPMRSLLRKADQSASETKSKGARGRSVRFNLPSNVPERTTNGQHPLAVRRGRPTPAPVPVPGQSPATPVLQPIQPLPLRPDDSTSSAHVLQQGAPNQSATSEAQRLDSLNQEAAALSYRLESLLRSSRRSTDRPSSDPLLSTLVRTSPGAAMSSTRSFSTGSILHSHHPRYSSPGSSPVFGSDPELDATLARARPLLEQGDYPGVTPPLGTAHQAGLTRPAQRSSLGLGSADNGPVSEEVDWNAAVTLNNAVYLDRDGLQSPTFGPVFQLDLERGMSGLGMRIAGGCDTRLGALFVAYIEPGGAADQSGQIAVGDRFLKVADADVRGMTQDNLRQCIAARLTGSNVVPFELMRIGRAQWHQLQRVAGIAKLDVGDSNGSASLSPLRKTARAPLLDPEAYTLEPTYLRASTSPLRSTPKQHRSAMMAPSVTRGRTSDSTGSLPGSLRSDGLGDALANVPSRSLSSDTLGHDLSYQSSQRSAWSNTMAASTDSFISADSFMHVHDPELYTLEPTYLGSPKVPSPPASGDEQADRLPTLPLERSHPVEHGDPRAIAARALQLAADVHLRAQSQRTPEPLPLTSRVSCSEVADTNIGDGLEPTSTATRGRVANLVVQPRLGVLQEQESSPDVGVRLNTVVAPIVRPGQVGLETGKPVKDADDSIDSFDTYDSDNSDSEDCTDTDRNNAHYSPIEEPHTTTSSHLVVANVDSSSSEELDMDASTPEPIDDDPIAPPSPISLPLQPVHTSVHAIAPRRRASASGPRPASLQGTSGSPDTTAVSSAAVSIPNLAEPNTDSSTNSPMTAVLQGAQETLQRRASASQELDLDSSHNTRRASIRDWIQSQKDEMKEQQTAQAETDAEDQRRRQQQLAAQQKQAARERQRLAQAASEQSRRQAALELEDDAAHAEISAALRRRGSITQASSSRRSSISLRTLEMRQQFLQSPTGRKSPASPTTTRSLPLPPSKR